jgi:hypothetical protein
MFSTTTAQALQQVQNYTLNAKGSDAWISTGNPLVNLFTIGSKKCPENPDEFNQIFKNIVDSLNADPGQFVQLMKFQRLIKNGNGTKWLYYLCMEVLKISSQYIGSVKIYEEVLDWSWEYPKDILRLHKLTNMYEPISSSSGLDIIIGTGSTTAPKGSLSSKLNAFSRQNRKAGYYGFGGELELQYEIVLYTNKVFEIFKNLMTPSSQNTVNPMFLKYMGYNTGHFSLETTLIWTALEKLVEQEPSFRTLVESEENLSTDLGTELREILKKTLSSPNLFTNKTRRLVKKCFNSHINLLDNLFKGVHSDGSAFGSHANEEEEIGLVCQQIKRSATLAYERFEKTAKIYSAKVKKWETYQAILSGDTEKLEQLQIRRHRRQRIRQGRCYPRQTRGINAGPETQPDETQPDETTDEITVPPQPTLKETLISKGYFKYLELLKEGKATVKTHGSDITAQIYEFFESDREFDQSVESKLTELATKLRDLLADTIGDDSFYELSKKFVLVLDISGSMHGIPIQTGLLYFVLMAWVFRITQLIYFESVLHFVDLDPAELDCSMCYLVRKIYKQTDGSTNLESVFEHFRTCEITNKNVIIITDGDCDPNTYGTGVTNETTNPFHTAPKSEQGLKYVVVNVKESKLDFPYLALDPDVCYLTGNNPKTLNGFIRALVVSIKESVPLTPTLVLKYSLVLDELTHSFEFGTFSKVYTPDEINRMFEIFKLNLPPKKISPGENVDGVMDENVDGVMDENVDGVMDENVDGVMDENVDGVMDENVDGDIDGIMDYSEDDEVIDIDNIDDES